MPTQLRRSRARAGEQRKGQAVMPNKLHESPGMATINQGRSTRMKWMQYLRRQLSTACETFQLCAIDVGCRPRQTRLPDALYRSSCLNECCSLSSLRPMVSLD